MNANDLRALVGNEVISRDGAPVGHVTSIVEQEGQPPFLEVQDDGVLGIGAMHFLVPRDAIASIGEGKVHVDKTKQDLTGVPAQNDDEPQRPDFFESLYAWWWRADAE